MTDDLVKRLRGIDGDSMSIKTLDEAAARIEALEQERDALRQAVSFANTVADTAMADMKAAEAALAKAVEALRFYSCDNSCDECLVSKRDRISCGWTARATLAETIALIDGGRT